MKNFTQLLCTSQKSPFHKQNYVRVIDFLTYVFIAFGQNDERYAVVQKQLQVGLEHFKNLKNFDC